MRIKFITGLILLMPFIGFSQGEFNNWYFGWYPPMGTGVTFNSGFPVTIPNGVLLTAATDVSILAQYMVYFIQ
ncbi:MAG: hypothetical protein WCP32_18700 [Bacteroidota bacterium]